ncbi:MAG: glycosyl transferase [Bryobacteraceae bacterium]|nr:MAG: glycosyl transferase [Bryobacteraceae bacterium]
MPNWLERVLAAAGLVVLSPVMAVLAAAVRLDSGPPVLFRHRRVGQGGRTFELLKFRSMVVNHGGPSLTRKGEARITRVGAWLRRWKLDELPQLINVVRGEMSLVGPRPEVPEYVDLADPQWRRVLEARPGITDPASLAFRNEEELLSAVENVEEYYRAVILPRKLALSAAYLERRTFVSDLEMLFRTVAASWLSRRDGRGGA